MKLTSVASGALRSTSRAISSITGIVRSALAKPPMPVVSWPISPNARPGELVAVTRLLPAHAQLRDHERRARERVGRIRRPAHLQIRAGGLAHAPREAPDDLEPLLDWGRAARARSQAAGRGAAGFRRRAPACTWSRRLRRRSSRGGSLRGRHLALSPTIAPLPAPARVSSPRTSTMPRSPWRTCCSPPGGRRPSSPSVPGAAAGVPLSDWDATLGVASGREAARVRAGEDRTAPAPSRVPAATGCATRRALPRAPAAQVVRSAVASRSTRAPCSGCLRRSEAPVPRGRAHRAASARWALPAARVVASTRTSPTRARRASGPW